jgi:hypothetical protein
MNFYKTKKPSSLKLGFLSICFIYYDVDLGSLFQQHNANIN